MIDNAPDTNHDDLFKKSPNNMELFLKTGSRYERLNLRKLLFIKTAGKYIELYFENDGKRLIRISLVNFLKEPSKIDLIRVHKSFVVNTAYITSYNPQEITVAGKKIPVGRRYKEELSGYMKQNTIDLNTKAGTAK